MILAHLVAVCQEAVVEKAMSQTESDDNNGKVEELTENKSSEVYIISGTFKIIMNDFFYQITCCGCFLQNI